MEQGVKYGGTYCNPNTLEAEIDGSEVQVYPGLHTILFPERKQNRERVEQQKTKWETHTKGIEVLK